jgi:hypothetical protein
MNIPDHISETLKQFFGLKYLNSLIRMGIWNLIDPGSGIRDRKNSNPGWKKFESGINILDPQH